MRLARRGDLTQGFWRPTLAVAGQSTEATMKPELKGQADRSAPPGGPPVAAGLVEPEDSPRILAQRIAALSRGQAAELLAYLQSQGIVAKESLMFPTEPGLYWAKITEGPGRPKPDSFNAVVEVYGESPFFQIDALVFAEPRCAVRSVPPQLVSFGPRIEQIGCGAQDGGNRLGAVG